MEIWKQVVGYEGLYEVSNIGSVRRMAGSPKTKTTHLLKHTPHTAGYPTVMLCRESRPNRQLVHRLVAFAFFGARGDAFEVNHKDGNKHNANLENLEWVTCKENMRHAVRTGLYPPHGCKGEAHGRAKLTEMDVKIIRDLKGKVKQVELAEEFSVSQPVISAIQLRKTWKHVA